ncbi:hypothetical protein EXU57_24265 [Segetibacter sp. 3557_3]|uniref:hypothetical protein n=1 Tax=Segetibacter sp. 3557_3 TaxID=2547429 RepID=UPI0010585968|nr:hypothetical protein [Segetibacter sp. 3557_3]TDH18168.1 hypothetical protein EXU57_24265 [Segetibacter sp. 3557_3]
MAKQKKNNRIKIKTDLQRREEQTKKQQEGNKQEQKKKNDLTEISAPVQLPDQDTENDDLGGPVEERPDRFRMPDLDTEHDDSGEPLDERADPPL